MNVNTSQHFTVVDGYSLASPFERIIAFLIDLVVYAILYVLLFILSGLIGISWLGGVIAGLYLILRDSIRFLNYQSPGKKIMKLKVTYNNDGLKLLLKDALKRNFIFVPALFFAFEVFSFIAVAILFILLVIELYQLYASTDHQRLGDQFADTIVIENWM